MQHDWSHIPSKECNHGHSDMPKDIEKKYRLAEFFDAHWDAYVKAPQATITFEQYKAVKAIRTCRTAVLGVDEYVC